MNIKPIQDRRPSKSLGLWPAHIQHGTEAGYNAHRYRKQKACDKCLSGHREYCAEKKRSREERLARGEKIAHPGRKGMPIEHGTDRGYQQHRRRKEPACDPCRTAWSQRMREDKAQRTERIKTLQGRRKAPKPIPIPPKIFAELYWTATDSAINQLDELFGRERVDEIIKIADQES